MDRVSATHTVEYYDGLAWQLAGTLARIVDGSLDHAARARDDYAQDLRLASIDVAGGFQQSVGFSLPAETRYVRKSLWNLFRRWRREYVAYSAGVNDGRGNTGDESYNPETQFEAAYTLGVLRKKLPKNAWELLKRVGESGHHCSAFDPKTDGSLATYKRRVASARRQARLILGGSSYECAV